MPTVFSGVAPSGVPHLGNYLGAVKNWLELQKDYRCIFCVVDLHAMTVPQDPAKLHAKILEVVKIYLAAGIDPEHSIVFVQSHVKEHVELCWILNTISKMSDLFRMTQFKDKTGLDENSLRKSWILKKGEKRERISQEEYYKFRLNRASVGLFDYPVLMAADILLYKTQVVPVGEDQLQHVELARTLAERFNQRFGEIFVVPKALVRQEGARIMALDDPTKKMSKSAASPYNYLALTDTSEMIKEKIKKAVTDSGKEIVASPEKPALTNLLMIYSLLAGKPIEDIEKEYQGKGYAEFKEGLTETVIDFLKPFQEKYNALTDEDVLKILAEGAAKAEKIASQTMVEVKNAVGLI